MKAPPTANTPSAVPAPAPTPTPAPPPVLSRVVPDRGAAQLRQAEANAAALAQAREQSAQRERERERLRQQQAAAREALEAARGRRADRERVERQAVRVREEEGREGRANMDLKVAGQMVRQKDKEVKSAQQQRDKEALRLKVETEERDAVARQKAKEGRDLGRRGERRREAPVSFLVGGEKEPVRVSPAAPSPSPSVGGAGDPSGRFRLRMKPSVPRQQAPPRSNKAPSPPVQRQKHGQGRRAYEAEVGATSPCANAAVQRVSEQGQGREGGGELSAAHERRPYDLLRARAVSEEAIGAPSANAAAALEVAQLDDVLRSSSSDNDGEVLSTGEDGGGNIASINKRRAVKLKNFEEQMGILQGIINDLSPPSGNSPKAAQPDGAPPPPPPAAPVHKPRKSDRPKNNKGQGYARDDPPPTPVNSADDLLAERRRKREKDRRDLRAFVAAQRRAQVRLLRRHPQAHTFTLPL